MQLEQGNWPSHLHFLYRQCSQAVADRVRGLALGAFLLALGGTSEAELVSCLGGLAVALRRAIGS